MSGRCPECRMRVDLGANHAPDCSRINSCENAYVARKRRVERCYARLGRKYGVTPAQARALHGMDATAAMIVLRDDPRRRRAYNLTFHNNGASCGLGHVDPKTVLALEAKGVLVRMGMYEADEGRYIKQGDWVLTTSPGWHEKRQDLRKEADVDVPAAAKGGPAA